MSARPNPFFARWQTEFGQPDFSQVDIDHFAPAIAAGIAEKRARIAQIAQDAAPPTFENTILALEQAGEILDRVMPVFWSYAGGQSSPALQDIERDIAVPLSELGTDIYQNEALFARVRVVYEQRQTLDPQQRRLVEKYYRAFVDAGALLTPEAKARVKAIHGELAVLENQFQDMVRAASAVPIVITDPAMLAGLPDGFIAQARQADGRWHFYPSRETAELILANGRSRALREQVYRAFKGRGTTAPHDTGPIILQIVTLRAELAQRMGYADYASFATADRMAQNPQRAQALLDEVWVAAKAKAEQDLAEIAAYAKQQDGIDPLQPWDVEYYATRIKAERFAIDEQQLSQYYSLDNMLAAAFDTAGRLFGVHFQPRPDLKGPHPDVRIWEVKDASGKTIALFYGDYFARPGEKRDGAWMSSFREQNGLTGEIPIITNTCNFNPPAPGRPALLTQDNVNTLFHEMGHALHGMLSHTRYPGQAGTSVDHDFVELPSQLFEHWGRHPDVMRRFARHWQTGEPIPETMLEKMRGAQLFDAARNMVEFLAAAMLDMAWHRLPPGQVPADAHAFERHQLQQMGQPALLPPRHGSAHFLHLFSSGAYAAGYYSYLWAQRLDADAFEAFLEKGDIFHPATAARLRALYAAGDTVDAGTLYRQFRGHDATSDALLRKLGLVGPQAPGGTAVGTPTPEPPQH